MKDRCGFLFVTVVPSWSDSLEYAACPLSGNKKRPLVGGWLNISSVVISSGATASVRYREVVCSGPLWEVPLYTSNSFHFFRMRLYLLFQWLWKSYCTKHLFPMRRIYHWHSNAWEFIRNNNSGLNLWRHKKYLSAFISVHGYDIPNQLLTQLKTPVYHLTRNTNIGWGRLGG